MHLTPAEICIPALVALAVILTVVISRIWTDLEKSYGLPERKAALDARQRAANAPRSPMELYLEGGGDLSNPRVAALLEEAERGWNRNHGGRGARTDLAAKES